jgi:hypothetical protein
MRPDLFEHINELTSGLILLLIAVDTHMLLKLSLLLRLLL